MLDVQRRQWVGRERARMLAESYAHDVGLGIMAGTRVATAVGMRAVESLKVGDKVVTFENRLQPVEWIERRVIWCGRNAEELAWPLHVPSGALANRDEMYLMPAQAIVIDCELAEQVFGSPYLRVPATALIGRFGITRQRPQQALEVVRFGFAQPEVVFANSGAMFHCGLRDDLEVDQQVQEGNYTSLPHDAAQHFLTCLEQGHYLVRAGN